MSIILQQQGQDSHHLKEDHDACQTKQDGDVNIEDCPEEVPLDDFVTQYE